MELPALFVTDSPVSPLMVFTKMVGLSPVLGKGERPRSLTSNL